MRAPEMARTVAGAQCHPCAPQIGGQLLSGARGLLVVVVDCVLLVQRGQRLGLLVGHVVGQRLGLLVGHVVNQRLGLLVGHVVGAAPGAARGSCGGAAPGPARGSCGGAAPGSACGSCGGGSAWGLLVGHVAGAALGACPGCRASPAPQPLHGCGSPFTSVHFVCFFFLLPGYVEVFLRFWKSEVFCLAFSRCSV